VRCSFSVKAVNFGHKTGDEDAHHGESTASISRPQRRRYGIQTMKRFFISDGWCSMEKSLNRDAMKILM
jgi:hypothetical protein